MDENRLLEEAQMIASKYEFFMVKGQVSHLYGYLYKTADGENTYPLDIQYDENFPEVPPHFSFPEPIPNLPEEIELQSLNSWTENSHVVNVVDELAAIVKLAVEGKPSQPEMQKIPAQSQNQGKKAADTSQTPPKSGVDSQQDQNQEAQSPQSAAPKPKPEQGQVEKNVESSPGGQTDLESAPVPEPKAIQKGSTEPNGEGEQYLTPDLNAYPAEDLYQQDTGQQYEQWTPEDFDTPIIQDDSTSQQIKAEKAQTDSQPKDETPSQPQTQPAETDADDSEYSPEEIMDTESPEDLQLTTEMALIQQEYAMDYDDNSISKVEIYLTITMEQTFIIKIDFSNYPSRPNVTLPSGLINLLGDVNTAVEVLKDWDQNHPPHVVEIVRELESKLWFLSDLQLESKMIVGEYKADMIDGIISQLRVTLYTYGFKEYHLEVDISNYPDKPIINYSDELKDLIATTPEQIKAYKNWKRKESHPVDIIREIQWLVDKNSRINFELRLLRGGMDEVEYNQNENSISAKLTGKMKTEGISFDFTCNLPRDYPMGIPKITLESKLEGQEDLKKKLTTQIDSFVSGWHQFNYLIDLFNQISKAIFDISVISCVICHKIDCPVCAKKISAQQESEQCQVQCPSCERLYHKSCWNQTIASFGKCGFCLKPPPANMQHVD